MSILFLSHFSTIPVVYDVVFIYFFLRVLRVKSLSFPSH